MKTALLLFAFATALLSMESDPRPVVALRTEYKLRDDKTQLLQAIAAGKITLTPTPTPKATMTLAPTLTPKAVVGTVTATSTSTPTPSGK